MQLPQQGAYDGATGLIWGPSPVEQQAIGSSGPDPGDACASYFYGGENQGPEIVAKLATVIVSNIYYPPFRVGK